MADILEIKRALEVRAKEVAEHLLPRGLLIGREWECGSVQGEPGHSLKICIAGHKVGTWADFAANGESGDLIDLWQTVKRTDLAETLNDIRQWLGFAAPSFESDCRPRTWRKPDRPKCSVPKSAVRSYLLDERKLSESALAAYRVGEAGRTIVLPSLTPDGELAFVKYLGIDHLPTGKKDTRVESGCEPILFGWSAIDRNSRTVTITEGEIDALTGYDYGWPSLSVPFGGGKGAKQSWIESEFDRLQRFETIYLALDMDKEGDAAVEEIVARLGRHRCRRVRLPHKDLNDCRKAGVSPAEIAECFRTAQTMDPAELQRAGEFTDAVIELFWPKNSDAVGYRLPFHKIAERLAFRPGELTLWTGASGSGKSQLLSHASVAWGGQGARVCVASLEMAPAQTLRRMVKQSANTDRPTESFIRQTMRWVDCWLWVFSLVGKSRVDRLLEVFEYARCRYGCDVFIIDSLMRLGIGSEDYEGQEKAVFEMVNWAAEKKVHIHLVAHARKGGADAARVPETEDVKGASEIGSNAFNIIGVWRNRKHEDEVRRAAEQPHDDSKPVEDKPGVVINVAKQRNGDWEGKFGLWFNVNTYQYRGSHDSRIGQCFVPDGLTEEDIEWPEAS